ncbi:MAG: hypothetical protein R3281_12960 [Balneolaceae bacterium]|nr:hypothetical protein [Balneolaceae bacterium]
MKKMIPYFALVTAILIIAVQACSVLTDSSSLSERIAVETDTAELSKRVQVVNSPVDIVPYPGLHDKAKADQKPFERELILVANVSSPIIDGNYTLSATAVDIAAKTLYVSYHRYGNPYAGAIDLIDLGDPTEPRLVSSVTFTDTDINGLEVDNNRKKLWVTGGRSVNQSGYDTEGHLGAIVGEFEMDRDGAFDFGRYRETPLPSYSGNALVEKAQTLYVAVGATGGGYVEIDKETFSPGGTLAYENAKYVERHNSDIIGLRLDQNHLPVFEILDFSGNELQQYAGSEGVAPQDGKNVVEHFAGVTYGALGNRGVKGFRFDGRGDPLVYEFAVNGNDVANGVTVDGRYVYIAHGTDGLFVTTHPVSPNKEPEEVYRWNSGMGSANFVKTDGQFLIVANGVDGLNVLRIEKM